MFAQATATTTVGLVAGLVLLAAAPVFAKSDPDHGIGAGVVDEGAACRQQYSDAWIAVQGATALDWTCRLPSTGKTGPVDLDAYCLGKYHVQAYSAPSYETPKIMMCFYPHDTGGISYPAPQPMPT